MPIKFEIESINIFLERRKIRQFVGNLIYDQGKFIFTYDDNYLKAKHIIPLGPEFRLTKRQFESTELFPSFEDRIPSKRNPAYPEYCHHMGIDPNENNKIILLATIGSKGPSSFIFVPVYKRLFTINDIVDFRKRLNLTTREFAQIFEISQVSLNALERQRSTGKDLLKKLELVVKFPEVAIYYLLHNGGVLQHKKRMHALGELVKMAAEAKEGQLSKYVDSKIKEIEVG